MHTIPDREEKARADCHIARVEERVLLQLLVPTRILAVSSCGIDHPAAGDALGLVGKAIYPSEPDDCRKDHDAYRKTHVHSPVTGAV